MDYKKLVVINYDKGEVATYSRDADVGMFLDFVRECNYIQLSHSAKGVLYIAMDKVGTNR